MLIRRPHPQAAGLDPRHVRSVRREGAKWRVGLSAAWLVGFTGFDPEGWTISRSLARQLDRYGIPADPAVAFLVRPQRFTAEEIALLAQPIPETDPTVATKIRACVAAPGGSKGRALRIHADGLHPVKRVVQVEIHRRPGQDNLVTPGIVETVPIRLLPNGRGSVGRRRYGSCSSNSSVV